jgi:L-ascorbate metabolism protein UlaG (beta-lactamase superfamily)
MRRTRACALALAATLGACTTTPQPKTGPYHPSDAPVSVTRIVHGSYLLDLAGIHILVDPWYFPRGILSQREPLGLTPRSLPTLHAILITHDHGDHLDKRALAALPDRTAAIVIRPGLGEDVAELGYERVTELDWWGSVTISGVAIHAVPADHSTDENGYVLQTGAVTVYVAGDTRFFPGLEQIAGRFPAIDVALLPIGGARFFGFRTEMGPRDAARAVALLQPRRVVPTHYGATGPPPVLWTVRNPVEKFRTALAETGMEDRLVVLSPGDSWHYLGE